MKKRISLLLLFVSTAAAIDLASLRADRSAIERVYYNHRLGDKPPFEQILPPASLDRLIQQDLRKEAVLHQVYGIAVTPAVLDAEVRRINATTRAPEMLTEIKAALGNDSERFANAFARPIVVERLLREKFESDDALHAAVRRKVEETRNALLAAKQTGTNYIGLLTLLRQRHSGAVTETVWQLVARPPETPGLGTDEAEIRKRFGPNAQILSPRTAEGYARFYFEDLPRELQNVLRAQLSRADDISAVIETPSVFLLYVAKSRTNSELGVAVLSLPKRSLEEWLDTQTVQIDLR